MILKQYHLLERPPYDFVWVAILEAIFILGRNKNKSTKRKTREVRMPESTSAINDWQKIRCSKKIRVSFIVLVDESSLNGQLFLRCRGTGISQIPEILIRLFSIRPISMSFRLR